MNSLRLPRRMGRPSGMFSSRLCGSICIMWFRLSTWFGGNKRIAFTAADVFLRRNGFYIEVTGTEGHAFIDGSMERHEFRFARILEWIRQHVKPLTNRG